MPKTVRPTTASKAIDTASPYPTTKKLALDIGKENDGEGAEVKKEERDDEDKKGKVLTDRPNPPNTTTMTATTNNNNNNNTGVNHTVVQGQKKAGSPLDVVLGDENGGTIPIYDSCDEIRARILAFLDSKPPVIARGSDQVQTDKRGQPKRYTRAQLLKDMGGVNTNSLTRFMQRTGERAGSEMRVYHLAYRFFEKFRIYNGEPKSTSRIENEKTKPEGYPLKDPTLAPKGGLWLTVGPGEDPNDFLTDEQKQRYYFPPDYSSSSNRRGRGRGRAPDGRRRGGAAGRGVGSGGSGSRGRVSKTRG